MAAFQAFKFGMMSFLLPGILMLTIPLISEATTYQRGRGSQCVRIENKLCQGNYNSTSMPNILGHEDLEEASLRLDEFKPLINNECSQHIKFFLCSLHFPMCVPQVPHGIPACREMCEEVRRNCEPYLKAFALDWPETIDCGKLPMYSSRQCLYPDKGQERREKTEDPENVDDDDVKELATSDDDVITEDDETIKQQQQPTRPNRRQRQNKRKKEKREKPKQRKKEMDTEIMDVKDDSPNEETREIPTPVATLSDEKVMETEEVGEEREEVKPSPKWNPTNLNKDSIYPEAEDESEEEIEYFSVYDPEFNQFVPTDGEQETPKCRNPDKFIYVDRSDQCLPICDSKIDIMFSSSDKIFAYYWMLACSILCIISSSFTVGTFLVDSKRFRYPERPIIFLSLCYLLYSSAYLVRLGRGPEGSVSCVTKDNSDVKHLVMGDLESTGCTAVFFLLYYFGMAAAVWWVILSVTWFLAAGLKWGHEAIEAHGFYFHLVAWLLPAVQTIVVLVMGKVDGDEVTGLCYVGNLEADSLLYFVIVPLTTYLAIGALALGCGFLSLLKIRQAILRKRGEKDAGKLEKLMLKIGIFTVLYIVPTACVVAVNVYQYNNHDIWMSKAEGRSCFQTGSPNNPNAPYDRAYRNAPDFPSYYDRTQGYVDYDYGETYIPRRRYYPEFGQPYPGYDRPQYVLPDTSYTGYGQSRYPDSLIPGYPYKSGSIQQDMGYGNTEDSDSQGSYDTGARPFYTGRELVAVPHHLTPRYPSTGRLYRRKPASPMLFNPKMAQALKAYGEKMNSGYAEVNRAQPSMIETKDERDCHLAESIPSFPIFAIKIFMSLLAGITSGIWVWSGKTYKSWKIFCTSSWCGRRRKDKGGDAPHATSSAPPSVTSHLLPKISGRPSPDGELPTQNGNRYSYPIISSDRYQGYHHVKQDDDAIEHDVMNFTSPGEQRGHTTGLTLRDIAREYSDNLDLQYREMTSPRNATYIVSQSMGGDVTDTHRSHFAKNQKLHPKNNKNSSKKPRNGASRDRDTPTFISKSNRAIPNIYEDTHSSRGVRYNKQTNRDLDGTYAKPLAQIYGKTSQHRVRKYSENDANKLCLVSESGFSPISMSTRRKAESVHVGTMSAM